MVDPNVVRSAIGIAGNIISMCLFLSPVPTFVYIIKKKSVQQFKPDPYLATILNCAMWVFYSMPFIHPDSTLVLTINSSGFVIEVFYVTIFFIYSPIAKWLKMSLILGAEIGFFAAVVAITLNCVHGTHARSIVVGALCVFLNVLMYASPLTIMKTVIRTKSVRFMPFWLSLANFLNGAVWLCYALIKFDPWLLVPNALGTALGIFQLILYATYYGSTNWDKPPCYDVEMSQV